MKKHNRKSRQWSQTELNKIGRFIKYAKAEKRTELSGMQDAAKHFGVTLNAIRIKWGRYTKKPLNKAWQEVVQKNSTKPGTSIKEGWVEYTHKLPEAKKKSEPKVKSNLRPCKVNPLDRTIEFPIEYSIDLAKRVIRVKY